MGEGKNRLKEPMDPWVAQTSPSELLWDDHKTDIGSHYGEMQVEWTRVRGIRFFLPREWAPEAAHGRDALPGQIIWADGEPRRE